jgi:hypothetical protein
MDVRFLERLASNMIHSTHCACQANHFRAIACGYVLQYLGVRWNGVEVVGSSTPSRGIMPCRRQQGALSTPRGCWLIGSRGVG